MLYYLPEINTAKKDYWRRQGLSWSFRNKKTISGKIQQEKEFKGEVKVCSGGKPGMEGRHRPDCEMFRTSVLPALHPLHIKVVKMKSSKTHSSKENEFYLSLRLQFELLSTNGGLRGNKDHSTGGLELSCLQTPSIMQGSGL